MANHENGKSKSEEESTVYDVLDKIDSYESAWKTLVKNTPQQVIDHMMDVRNKDFTGELSKQSQESRGDSLVRKYDSECKGELWMQEIKTNIDEIAKCIEDPPEWLVESFMRRGDEDMFGEEVPAAESIKRERALNWAKDDYTVLVLNEQISARQKLLESKESSRQEKADLSRQIENLAKEKSDYEELVGRVSQGVEQIPTESIRRVQIAMGEGGGSWPFSLPRVIKKS